MTPLLNPYFDLYEILKTQSSEVQLALRKKLIWAYSWAIPNSEVIDLFASEQKIIEWGAGTGYWAWLLEQAGAQVRSFDLEKTLPQWHSVVIEKSFDPLLNSASKDALLLCWPPLDSPMALDAVSAFAGKTILYVGEWNGRTANSQFHEKLEAEWRLKDGVVLPRWPGFSDRAYRLVRK